MSTPLLTVLRSLSLGQDRRSDLHGIPDAAWRKLLDVTDITQLTLPLAVRCRQELPEWVQERLAGNLQNNAIRHERTLDVYREVDRVLTSKGLDFMVLKGFSQWPHYCDDLRQRPQYDLDLYCPPDEIEPAFEAIRSLGYEPFGRKARTATDHLPPLIRKTGWRADGDHYNTDLPLTIELHFRFWDEAPERFGVDNADGFWQRRVRREIQGLGVPTLNAYDGLSYTTWHLVRHLVRGDVRAYHVYELAHFLQRTADDDLFWRHWRRRKSSTLAEAIAFRLAVDWFECPAHPVVQELCQELPASVRRWFDLFALSPLRGLERPNKDELFLHWCLVKGWPARLQIAKQRLLPARFSPVILDAHMPTPDWRLRLKRRAFAIWFMAGRAFHHVLTLAPMMWNGFRWRRALAK